MVTSFRILFYYFLRSKATLFQILRARGISPAAAGAGRECGAFRAPTPYGISPPAGGEDGSVSHSGATYFLLVQKVGKDAFCPPCGRGRGNACTPIFLFCLAKKEKRPCTVKKKKGASAFRLSGRSTWFSARNRVAARLWYSSLSRSSPAALCAYLCCLAAWSHVRAAVPPEISRTLSDSTRPVRWGRVRRRGRGHKLCSTDIERQWRGGIALSPLDSRKG